MYLFCIVCLFVYGLKSSKVEISRIASCFPILCSIFLSSLDNPVPKTYLIYSSPIS